MDAIQKLIATIGAHVTVLLSGKQDIPNRHWSATRIIVHAQALSAALPQTTMILTQNENAQFTPQHLRELFSTLEADFALMKGGVTEAAGRMHHNAVLLEAASATAAVVFGEVLQKCNYHYIGLPPPQVVVAV